MKKVLCILLLLSISCRGQSKNPDVIIKNLKEAFNIVKDYSVDVKINVDVNFIKVPEMKAKIFFKQPDKVHIESEGFAMLPRDGLYTSPLSFLNNKYTAFYAKDEILDGHNTSVVKIIPLNDKGDLILTTLWIDQSKEVIRKIESSTKLNGTFTISLSYNNNMKYPLPDSMVFSFNAGKLNIPFEPGQGEIGGSRKKPKVLEGKVFIKYFNYVVNKGIPADVFKKSNVKRKEKYGRL